MKKQILFLTFLLSSTQIFSQDVKIQLGPEVLVSNNNEGSALRVEPSAVIHDSIAIVAWNDSYGGMQGHTIGVSIGWAISYDQGEHFTFGGYLPRTPQDSLLPAADSWLQADENGNFYLQLLMWQGTKQKIKVYIMHRERLGEWQQMTDPVSVDKSVSVGIDKPAMAVAKNGKIGIVYSHLTKPHQGINFVRSIDQGKTWSDSVRLSDSENNNKTGANIAISNSKVIVTWIEDSKQVWYTISNDGGITFGEPTMLYEISHIVSPPEGYALGVGPAADILNSPWIASGDNGNFYLTVVEGVQNGGTRLLLFTMLNNSNKWLAPKKIGKSPDASEKVFPSVATVNSIPSVLYYDRRANPDSTLTDVYLSIQQTSESYRDLKLNTVSTDWLKAPGDKKYAMIQRNFGDYITVTAHKNILLATWADAREGPSRIYARVIRFTN